MKSKKLTKLLAMLIALTAVVITGCSNAASESGSSPAPVYKVEYGRMEKSYYETFMSNMGNGQNFNFQAYQNLRTDFKDNHTIDGTYVAQSNYSYAALKALLRRDLQAGLTPEGEIEGVDFLGNNITFIDVTQGTDWVTWVYIEK